MDNKAIVVLGALLVLALVLVLSARNMAALGVAPGVTRATAPTTLAASPSAATTATAGAGGVQDVTLKMRGTTYYTEPAALQPGVPVRMTVDLSTVTGCMRDVVMPGFGIRKYVSQGDNVIAFTAPAAGSYPISCSMGMGRGVITVGDAAAAVAAPSADPSAAAPAAGTGYGSACGATGTGSAGGCGCGG